MASYEVKDASAWRTTILVHNVHCASCVSYIQRILAGAFRDALQQVETSILSHGVTVLHHKLIPTSILCHSLSDAAFEVHSATTFDERGAKVQEIGDEGSGDDWLEAATEFWRPSHRASSSGQHLVQSRKSKHMANCDACRKGSISKQNEDLSTEMLVKDALATDSFLRPASIDVHEEEIKRSLSAFRDGSHPVGASLGRESTPTGRYEAILSIGGMTCASCTSAIDHRLKELPYVELINVTLMTNSAQIVFRGFQNLRAITEAIEDLGYDCAVERSSPIESAKHSFGDEGRRRSVMLKVDGMFCKHCPLRIMDSIRFRCGERFTFEQQPTLKDPFLKISYTPHSPEFTIRNVVSAVESVDKAFSVKSYTPPSIEEKSQTMQKQEQHRLFIRLILSFVIAIPTLLIGVVWMSLVPASNPIRMFFEKPVWSGNVMRADWALFILSTPVFFLAADVFHLRAIKEIRALWREGSRVPLLQRFYRFGSMNLLISAGTSIAYFASIAVLGINATATSRSPGQSSTYFDSVVFLTFFILIGRFLEAYSKAKTGNAVGMLSSLRPREAALFNSSDEGRSLNLESDGNEEKENMGAAQTIMQKIDANFLELGDIILVSHGSSPPADGILLDDCAKFNESSLTGESRPVLKQKGDTAFTGAINVGGPIRIEITKVGGTSMLEQIVAVVREGQTKRAPVERVVDVVTGYFVPVITALAITTFIIWLALGYSGALSQRYLGSQQGGWAFWSLEFAIAVFVVACPCGIGLAAPTALFVGSGLAASHGILVRGGGEAFQEASSIDGVVFDKTGTLTEGGELKVTDVEMLVEGHEVENALSIAKAMEETSSHPIARAIVDYTERQASQQALATTITEEPGLGIRGTFQTPSSTGHVIYEAALGSESLISSLTPAAEGLDYFASSTLSTWKSQSKSVALLALRKVPETDLSDDSPPWKLATMFVISDPIRASAIPTITTLQERGIPVYMLTGDNPITASAVAGTLSIPQDHVFAGVLPTEKASKIRWLQENGPRRLKSKSWLSRLLPRKLSGKVIQKGEKEKAIIAFVGDGINDAPALTTASVSISLSGASDIAVNSSSFILLSSSLENIVTLFDLSERVFRRVKFNFGWAVIYNIVLVPVAAGCAFKIRSEGWRLGPVWGSAAMALSSLCVVGSSLALRWEGGWGVGRMKRAFERMRVRKGDIL